MATRTHRESLREGRRKKEEGRRKKNPPPAPPKGGNSGRRKKEEGRRKKEEGRRKKEEGRRKKEEGRRTPPLPPPRGEIQEEGHTSTTLSVRCLMPDVPFPMPHSRCPCLILYGHCY
ncbi:MAG: hypothetical protein ACM65M_01915 [Microcoleus sp.]